MSGSLRILFLSSCVRGGGAGWSLYYLLRHLDRDVIEPLVVVPSEGIFGERFSELSVPVVVSSRLPERTAQQRFHRASRSTDATSYTLNLIDSARFIPKLATIIRREKCQLVYCNNMMVKPIGALAAQLTDVPCVFHARNLHERLTEVLFYCEFLARLPAVKRVVSNSAASSMPFKRAVPNKVSVVHNGVDLEEYAPAAVPRGEFRRAHGIGQQQMVVGFTGNLIERKGLEPLIRAAAHLVAEGHDAIFVAAGRVPIGAALEGSPDGYLARCQALLREFGLQDRFHFVGFMPDVRPAVVDFDILVLPSLQEPFGRSLIEAMALGTPVVATRVGGIPEIIRDEVDGLLVPPNDPVRLASAIARLVEDSTLRRTLAESSRRRVRDCFDVVKLTAQLQAVFLDVAIRSGV